MRRLLLLINNTDIERETERKEIEREAKELEDWEEMKKKQLDFHLGSSLNVSHF